jgi:GT2 family glycosyltransferase
LPGDRRDFSSCQASHQPLNQLAQLGANHWQALDEDPQFLLAWPEALPAGPYRLTAMLEGEGAVAPCIYFDFGDGWSEANCLYFEEEGAGSRWTLLAWLPPGIGPARFDPMAHAGTFRFDGVLLELLSESEALLQSMRRHVDEAPASAAAFMQETFARAASQGFGACWTSLLSHGVALPSSGAMDMSYQAWIRRFDTLAPAQLEALRKAIARLPRRPLVSLVLQVRQAGVDDVRSCIDSILAQLYPDWELCLADDMSSSPEVERLIREYAGRHSRIRLIQRRPDQALVAHLNDALSGAQGQYIGFPDGLPILPRHALLAFVDVVVRHPDAGIAYCDSDRIEGSGRRAEPYFKPDWNPDLFLSQDYLNPLALYASRLVRDVGPLRDGFEDAWLHDLALRCVSKLQQDQVIHVPLVLCHARERSAGHAEAAAEAGRRALVEHLGGARAGVEVTTVASGYRVHRALPRPAPKVSLIVPTRDRVDLLRQCVDSICSLSTYPAFEVVIVDNQSSEAATLEYFASLQGRHDVRVLAYDAAFNYSAINNFAVQHVDGELVGLINNDIEVISPGWLEEMVQHALRPEVGAVGAMLYYPDDTIQHAGVIVGLGGVAGHPYSRAARGASGQMGRAGLVQDLSAATGACLLVRRSVYEAVGGLNEQLSVAFNDIDFCLRLRARGWRNVWTPFAELYHHESASRGVEDTPAKRARFESEVEYMLKAWEEELRRDPAYSASLSLLHDHAFELSPQPRYSVEKWASEFTR